jgi:hypothetical protein
MKSVKLPESALNGRMVNTRVAAHQFTVGPGKRCTLQCNDPPNSYVNLSSQTLRVTAKPSQVVVFNTLAGTLRAWTIRTRCSCLCFSCSSLLSCCAGAAAAAAAAAAAVLQRQSAFNA